MSFQCKQCGGLKRKHPKGDGNDCKCVGSSFAAPDGSAYPMGVDQDAIQHGCLMPDILQPQRTCRVRSSELVVPQPDTEPCVLCSGNGWRKVWFQGRLEERTCCDCHGKGVRPVRQNDKLSDGGGQ